MPQLMGSESTRPEVRHGLVASIASIVWTAGTSAVAISYGISALSVVLIAFGAVGFFDMAGSIALAAHFRHALRHEAISAHRERVAHLVVSFGMLTVGVSTLVGSGIRLAHNGHQAEPLAGLVTSAASIVVLGFLGVRKRAIGRRIPSRALVTDGSLSLTGAGTAACAVIGLCFSRGLGWSWVDPVAAIAIALVAIATATLSLRSAG